MSVEEAAYFTILAEYSASCHQLLWSVSWISAGKKNTVSCKQFRRLLEYVEANFLVQELGRSTTGELEEKHCWTWCSQRQTFRLLIRLRLEAIWAIVTTPKLSSWSWRILAKQRAKKGFKKKKKKKKVLGRLLQSVMLKTVSCQLADGRSGSSWKSSSFSVLSVFSTPSQHKISYNHLYWIPMILLVVCWTNLNATKASAWVTKVTWFFQKLMHLPLSLLKHEWLIRPNKTQSCSDWQAPCELSVVFHKKISL